MKNQNKQHPQKHTVIVGKKLKKLEWQALHVVGISRRGSKLTRKDRESCLCNIGRAMQRYGLNSIKDIKPAHVLRYFAELRDKGLSASRMANHATAMRALTNMMGKDVVPSNAVLGCDRSLANRTKHSDERLNPEKVAEVRAQLSENNQIAYDQARYFGLRLKETLLSHLSISRDGVEYLVVAGAKGGRPREVPVTTPEQREVLDRNAAYRDTHGGTLVDADKSLLQGIRHLQNELAAAGATRNSGANMHALRRQWIIDRCEEIAASPEETHQLQLKELMDRCGHGRIEVGRCYSSILTPRL